MVGASDAVAATEVRAGGVVDATSAVNPGVLITLWPLAVAKGVAAATGAVSATDALD